MQHRRLLLCATVLAAFVAPVASADAAVCGEFSADDGDNIIVYGEFAIPGTFLPGERELGVCWLDEDGDWNFEHYPDCDNSTPSTDVFEIRALGGDDVVIPAVRDGSQWDFVCNDYAQFPAPLDKPFLRPMYSHPADGNIDVYCGTAGRYGGCSGVLRFGIRAFGGPGEDSLHGTPSHDELYANEPTEWCTSIFGAEVCFVADLPGDGGSDVMCGYRGDDELHADATNDRELGSCMDGGYSLSLDADVCEGQNNNVDRVTYDYFFPPVVIDGVEYYRSTCDSYTMASRLNDVEPSASADACCWTNPGIPNCAPHWSSHIEECVCDADSYCCDNEWDWLCVDQVTSVCGQSCDGPFDNGCYDVCQNTYTVDGVEYVVPPLIDVLMERFGEDALPGFSRWPVR